MTFFRLQNEIGNWGGITFPNATQESIIAHLRDEVNDEIFPDCPAEELADAVILLMMLAQSRDIDLEDAVWAKHEINKKRKWGTPDSRGVIKHIEE